jgi:hypothetical protein
MEMVIFDREAVIGKSSYRQNDYYMELARAACLPTILLYCDICMNAGIVKPEETSIAR